MKTIALFVICALPAACSAWHVAELQPQQFSEAKSPKLVRLTLNGGPRIVASHPVIVGDSLVWTESRRRAVPASSIRRVEVRAFAPDRSIAMLLLLGGLVYLVHSLKNATFSN